ncbi:hypothetical protein ACWD67_34965, partial [Streptomyces sp. 900116325]
RDARAAVPRDPHDILAELFRVWLGHSDILPTCPTGQASSDVTQSCVRPGAYYVGDWMHGHSNAGEQVHLRHEPHHYHQVELYDADTGRYRGPATRADEMTPQQARTLRRAWQREADHFAAKRNKARKNARARYAATSAPVPPTLLNRLTAQEAAAQLRDLQAGDLAAEARPDLLPRPKPTSERWTAPKADSPKPPTQEKP